MSIAETEKFEYEENWAFNAAYYQKQDCYEWMAAQLDQIKPRKVFDIGCGTGEGLSALRKRFSCNILSIDENAYCLKKSAAIMRSLGARVQTCQRYIYHDDQNGRHVISIKDSPITLSREVMLVQADILLPDELFMKFLLSKAPFDAVTIWLTGAYMGRQSCINLDPLNMRTFKEYRLHVQNKTYSLAAQVLRSGGLLQVVDRGEMPNTQLLHDDLIAAHKEQASVTDLEVQEMKCIPYKELSEGKGVRGVRMALSQGTSGRIPETIEYGMFSVLSRKPQSVWSKRSCVSRL
jgi:SAM-dependent methyltransferase